MSPEEEPHETLEVLYHFETKRAIPGCLVYELIHQMLRYILYVTGQLPDLQESSKRATKALQLFSEQVLAMRQQSLQQLTILMGETLKYPARVIHVTFSELSDENADCSQYVEFLSKNLASVSFELDRNPLKTFILDGWFDQFHLKKLSENINIIIGPRGAVRRELSTNEIICVFRGFAISQENEELDDQ